MKKSKKEKSKFERPKSKVRAKGSTDAAVEKLKEERDNFKQKYLRALADYQNFERRKSNEQSMVRTATIREIAVELLPFLDHLEKAEVFINDSGLSMIKEQYLQFLNQIGIRELEVIDKPFDPHTAEAIEVVEGSQDNMVTEVLQKGYTYEDYILRAAQVKVEKAA